VFQLIVQRFDPLVDVIHTSCFKRSNFWLKNPLLLAQSFTIRRAPWKAAPLESFVHISIPEVIKKRRKFVRYYRKEKPYLFLSLGC